MLERSSGRLLLRLDARIHRALRNAAQMRRTSINALCCRFIEEGLADPAAVSWWHDDVGRVVDRTRRYFSQNLLGVVVFGSQVQGSAHETSDVDILIVLRDAVAIRRELYRFWDENIAPHIDDRINPQFVNAPAKVDDAGGIWHEVAMASNIMWERGRAITTLIKKLRKNIEDDRVRRYWAHGQPYWVRREHEKQGSGA